MGIQGNGENTFKQCSIIDYSIVSAQASKFVSSFEICELDPLFTDGHSLLITTLRFPDVQPKINQQKHENVKKQPKWQDDKRNVFALNIDESKIGDLRTQLQQMQHRATSINKDNLNEICSSIANVFQTQQTKASVAILRQLSQKAVNPIIAGLGHSANLRGESTTLPAELTIITLAYQQT